MLADKRTLGVRTALIIVSIMLLIATRTWVPSTCKFVHMKRSERDDAIRYLEEYRWRRMVTSRVLLPLAIDPLPL